MRTCAKTLLLFAILCALEPARGVELRVGPSAIRDGDNYDAPIALIRHDQPFPRYSDFGALFSVSLILAYMHEEGLLVSLAMGTVTAIALTAMFAISASCANSPEAMWHYPFMNAARTLSNPGAVGPVTFILGIFVPTILGGLVGEVISWSVTDSVYGGRVRGVYTHYNKRYRHYKMTRVANYLGRYCCGLCSPYAANAGGAAVPMSKATEAMLQSQTGMPAGSPAAYGQDTDSVSAVFTATSGGDLITYGTTADVVTIALVIWVTAGPLTDWYSLGHLTWLGVGATLVHLVLLLIFFQSYEFGEFIDFPITASDARIRNAVSGGSALGPVNASRALNIRSANQRLVRKIVVLTPPFVHIFLFQVAMAILASVMASESTFHRIMFGGNASAMRLLADEAQNLKLVTISIAGGGLLLVAFISFLLVAKDALPDHAVSKSIF